MLLFNLWIDVEKCATSDFGLPSILKWYFGPQAKKMGIMLNVCTQLCQ
jgi:hypothetical protein